MTNHIFAAQTRQGTLKIYEISRGNVDRLPQLEAVFLELFPQYEQYLPRLRAIARGDRAEYRRKQPHQWLATIDDVPAGLTNFTYSRAANCGLGHNLAVLKEYRAFSFGSFRRLSEILIYLARQQIMSDASGAGQAEPAGLLVEVEMPATTSDRDLQRRRAHLFDRYEDYGIIKIPVCYYEPPGLIRNGKKQPEVVWARDQFRPMHLGLFPTWPKEKVLVPETMRALLKAFLCHHYGLPQDHWAVLEGLASIASDDDAVATAEAVNGAVLATAP